MAPWRRDSTLIPITQMKLMAFEETRKLTRVAYAASVKTYGKTLIFLLLPMIALVFYLFSGAN